MSFDILEDYLTDEMALGYPDADDPLDYVGALNPGAARGVIIYGNQARGMAQESVGALVAEMIPWSQVETFNAEVEHLNTDVTAWAQPDVARQVVLLEWQRFYMPWRAWFAQTYSDLPAVMRVVAGERLEQLRQLQRQYAELLRSLQERGVKTTAAMPTTPSWFERLVTGSGTSKPLIPWWIWAGGAAVLLVPVLTSVVGPVLMMRGATK